MGLWKIRQVIEGQAALNAGYVKIIENTDVFSVFEVLGWRSPLAWNTQAGLYECAVFSTMLKCGAEFPR